MVQTKAEVLAAIRDHAARLRDFGVKRCGLFGSFVREHGTRDSDVDVLVEFEAEKKTFVVSRRCRLGGDAQCYTPQEKK